MTLIGPWDRALLCGVLTMARPDLFGGVLIRAAQGPVLQQWLTAVDAMTPQRETALIMPASVAPDRLHASLSVARSLSEGRPIYQTGLLEEAEGRALIVNGVERLTNETAALLSHALDQANQSAKAPIAFIGIDESFVGEASISAILAERLAFRADLHGLRPADISAAMYGAADFDKLQQGLGHVTASDEAITTVASACVTLGVRSLQVPIFCLHAARAMAVLGNRSKVTDEDITIACQLVLPGRGQPLPESSQAPEPQSQTEPQDGAGDSAESEPEGQGETGSALESQIIEAAMSAPVELKASTSRRAGRQRAGISGRSGEHVIAFDRGRPDRPMKSQSVHGRIDVLATLRAASPLQTMRRRQRGDDGLHIRKSDLRIKRFKRRKQSSVIFVVDASGSAAMHRMAEAKGAVERLLSQCYSRRDMVSLIAFAGEQAKVVLPPSRSLVRARRQISDLAGGGATPLAHAVVEAYKLARAEQDRGRTPFIVFLTDGRGNIALDGAADRSRSADQVSQLGRTLIKGQYPAVFFDTSRRADPRTRRLSEDLGGAVSILAQCRWRYGLKGRSTTHRLAIGNPTQVPRLERPPQARHGDPNWAQDGKDWPHRADSEFWQVGPTIWHVQRRGAGPQVLLLHGTGAATHSWTALIDQVGDRFEMISIDLPGHGFTQMRRRFQPSLPNMSAAIIELLDAMQIAPGMMIGHSAGAAIALQMLARLGKAPETLVCINGAFEPFDGAMQFIAPIAAKAATVRRAGRVDGVSQLCECGGRPPFGVQYRFGPGSCGSSALLSAVAKARSCAGGSADDGKLGFAVIAERARKGARAKSCFLLAHGIRRVPAAVSERAAGRMQAGTYLEFEDLGHLAHEEAPDLVAAAIVDHWDRLRMQQ